MSSADGRVPKLIRLRPGLVLKIEKLRRKRDQSFQKFVQLALSKALIDAGVDIGDEYDPEEVGASGTRAAGGTKARGLGVRERLEQSRAEEEEPDEEEAKPAPPTPAPAPVVVQVTTPGKSDDTEITTLARVVIASPDRKSALRSSCLVLAKRCKTTEEALALADKLTDEIKRLDDKPMTALERIRERRKTQR